MKSYKTLSLLALWLSTASLQAREIIIFTYTCTDNTTGQTLSQGYLSDGQVGVAAAECREIGGWLKLNSIIPAS